MAEYILMAVMATVIMVLLLLRTNTGIGFLALCAGSVLVASSGANVGLVASSLTSGMDYAYDAAEVILLLVPVLVASVMLKGQIHRAILPLAAIPAACTAILAVAFITPLLPEDLKETILTTETWSLIAQYQEPVIVVGLASSLVMISVVTKKPHDKHKKGKH